MSPSRSSRRLSPTIRIVWPASNAKRGSSRRSTIRTSARCFHIVDECLILELVEGETLQQRLIRGPLPIREALRYAAGIAAALEAAHSKGIIHRDLKPANIKITSAGTIKVLDFGVAKLAEDSESGVVAPDITAALGGTKEGVLVGTVAYTSPEQAMGDRVDRRSDIWAFGCVLYEMLTARRAFHGTAVADTLGAVMRGEPDWSALPAATPPEIRKLLRRCLEKDRARRLADIADARLEIDDLLAGRSETAAQIACCRHQRHRHSTGTAARHLIAVLAFVAGVILASVVAIVIVRRQAVAILPLVKILRCHRRRLVSRTVSRSAELTRSGATRPRPLADTAPVAPREPVSVSINLPDGVRWAAGRRSGVPNTILAMSPDGRLRRLQRTRRRRDGALASIAWCPMTSGNCLEQKAASHRSGRPTVLRLDSLPIES